MTIIAETAERDMARRYGFCGNCGTAFTSADDQYCRICEQSEHHTGTAPRSAATRWSWRFLLVIPAFVVGYIVPGMLVRISTELGTLIPGAGVLFVPMAEGAQTLVDGACAVLFARFVVPYAKMGVSLAVGITVGILTTGLMLFTLFFTNYYAGVGFGTVLWQVVLMFLSVIGAGLAVLYAYIQAKQSRPG
jgi:hypothetical protein